MPKGWLRDWALAAADGITGHLDEHSPTFGEGWKGHWFNEVGVQPDGTGWPLEQCSYWLDGAVRLGYILNDTALISRVTKRLDAVVHAIGWLSPGLLSSATVSGTPRNAIDWHTQCAHSI